MQNQVILKKGARPSTNIIIHFQTLTMSKEWLSLRCWLRLVFALICVGPQFSCAPDNPPCSTSFYLGVRNLSEKDVYIYTNFSNYNEKDISKRSYRNDSLYYYIPKDDKSFRSFYGIRFKDEELYVDPIEWFQSEFPEGEISVYERIWARKGGYGPGKCLLRIPLKEASLSFYEDHEIANRKYRTYGVLFTLSSASLEPISDN